MQYHTIYGARLFQNQASDLDALSAEIALNQLFSFVRLEKKFVALPRYPGVSRDISLVLAQDIPVEQVIQLALAQGGELLQEVEPTDCYKGKQIEPGFKGLTVSCLYSSSERTLTEEEINPIHAGIVQCLKDRLHAKIR